MDCNTLNGISGNNCDMSIGGIKKVYAFPFDKIDQYTYTDDDLNYVSGYSSLVLPSIIYSPEQSASEYTGNKSERNYKLYDHQLTMNFNTMTREKRAEFKSMEDMDLTLILQDRNGRCWIMGQDVPCRLDSLQVGTGVKDGVNGYEVVIQSTEKQHLREIVCPSDGCFTSFTATEGRLSVFNIEETNSFDWEYIETDINGTIVSLDLSNSPLQPSLWNSDPTVLFNDRSTLMTLFSSLGATVNNLYTFYDVSSQTTTIGIESTNSAYGTFQVDNVVFNKSAFLATLTLNSVLSPGIANSSTIIEVTDSNGAVVFSEPYGDSVASLANITGTSDNAQLNMSALYPNGTTLTIQLINVPCSEVVYTYNYINTLEACLLERDYTFGKSLITEIEVPYLISSGSNVITERFQNTTINIFGNHFQLYKNYTQWHDDYNQFVNDVTLLLYQVVTPINLSTLVFTDTGTSVKISFKVISQSEFYYRQQVIGFDSELLETEWRQARSVNMSTIAPLGSVITHEDSHFNVMKGENLVNITQNSFELANNTQGNISVDNVQLLWNWNTVPYDANSKIITSSLGGNCNTADVNTPFDECYEDYTSTYAKAFEKVSLTCSAPTSINMGNQFFIEYNQGGVVTSQNFTLASNVTPNNNVHYLTEKLNSIKDFHVVHYDFDVVTRTYNFWITMENGTSLLKLTDTVNSRDFTLGSISTLYKNEPTTKINPFIELSWDLPTNLPSVLTPSEDLTYGHWQLQENEESVLNVIFDAGAKTLDITKVTGIPNAIVVSLHEDYPTVTNTKWFDMLNSGVTNKFITNIDSTLVANGSSLAAIKYVAYTNNVGWRLVQAIDMSGSVEVAFSEFTQTPICFGTPDSMNYVGFDTLDQPLVINPITTCGDLPEDNLHFRVNGNPLFTNGGSPTTNDDITVLYDQSPNGFDMNVVSANPVKWVDNVINGKPAMKCDSSYLANTSFNLTSLDVSIFVVLKRTSSNTGSYGNPFILAQTVGTPGSKFVQLNEDLSNNSMYQWNLNTGGLDMNVGANTNDTILFSLVKTATGIDYYKDGVLLGSGTGAQSFDNSTIMLGGWAANFFNGYMAEIVIYDEAVTLAKHTIVSDKLKTYYGI